MARKFTYDTQSSFVYVYGPNRFFSSNREHSYILKRMYSDAKQFLFIINVSITSHQNYFNLSIVFNFKRCFQMNKQIFQNKLVLGSIRKWLPKYFGNFKKGFQ